MLKRLTIILFITLTLAGLTILALPEDGQAQGPSAYAVLVETVFVPPSTVVATTTLKRYDSVTLAETGSLPLANNAASRTIAVGRDGRVWIGETDGTSPANPKPIEVVDGTTMTSLAVITVPNFPSHLVLDPVDENELYVISQSQNQIHKIDTATLAIVASSGVITNINFPDISNDGTRLYLTNDQGTTTKVVDTDSLTVVAELVSTDPDFNAGVALSPDNSRAYVSKENAELIEIFDTTTLASVGTVASPNFVQGFALRRQINQPLIVMRGRTIGSPSSSHLLVFDTVTEQITASLVPTYQVGAVAQTADGSAIWASTQSVGQPAVIRILDTSLNQTGAIVSPTPVSPFNQFSFSHVGFARPAPAIDPDEAIQLLIGDVSDLTPPLSSNQNKQLVNKLDDALDALNEGKVDKAIDKLTSFQVKVQEFIDDGTLTPAQGQPLIDEAQAIIDALS